MSLWDALRMNMMISYQELVRTFLSAIINHYFGAPLFLERVAANHYRRFS
jgi:hypothetical protein